MKQTLFFCLIAFSSFCLNAQESTKIKTESSVDFKIKNFGVNVDGYFETVSISTLFNSENELTGISATVEVGSITTGMESRDNHILKEDFFDVIEHENIMLKTINIKKKSLDSYLATANLTIKNISKQITIPIQVKKTDEGFALTSNFDINRKDFNVGGSSLVLGKTVNINVKHTEKF